MDSFKNLFAVPELRKRILFTFGLLAVYRIGSHIPTPGINADLLQQFFQDSAGTVLGFMDIFSGGNLRRLTVFALGVMPYITASIILQLLTPVWPYLDRLNKEGEMGRNKITSYSYMRGSYAYLEEDCDWFTFDQACRQQGITYTTREAYREHTPIRFMRHYHYQAVAA